MLYTKHTKLIDTTLTTLFSVPNGFHAILQYIYVANHNNNSNFIDMYWDLSGTPQVYIFDGTFVNGLGNTTLSNSGGPLFVLHENESLKCQAVNAGDLEVAVTFELHELPNTFINFNGS
jgi:hypothetical protein